MATFLDGRLPNRFVWSVDLAPSTAVQVTIQMLADSTATVRSSAADLTAILWKTAIRITLPTGSLGFQEQHMDVTTDTPTGVTLGAALQAIYAFYATPLTASDMKETVNYTSPGFDEEQLTAFTTNAATLEARLNAGEVVLRHELLNEGTSLIEFGHATHERDHNFFAAPFDM